MKKGRLPNEKESIEIQKAINVIVGAGELNNIPPPIYFLGMVSVLMQMIDNPFHGTTKQELIETVLTNMEQLQNE